MAAQPRLQAISTRVRDLVQSKYALACALSDWESPTRPWPAQCVSPAPQSAQQVRSAQAGERMAAYTQGLCSQVSWPKSQGEAHASPGRGRAALRECGRAHMHMLEAGRRVYVPGQRGGEGGAAANEAACK